jgi:hypothetical protein
VQEQQREERLLQLASERQRPPVIEDLEPPEQEEVERLRFLGHGVTGG